MNVYRDPDVPIAEALGQTFAICLTATPSGGYTWMEEYDPDMIELLKPKYYVPRLSQIAEQAEETAIGESREEMFEFRTRRAGETSIQMKNQRQWETTARETKIFRVRIAGR